MPLRPGTGVPRDHPDLHVLDGVRQNWEVDNGREEHVFGAFRDSRPDSWYLHQPSWHHQDLLMNLGAPLEVVYWKGRWGESDATIRRANGVREEGEEKGRERKRREGNGGVVRETRKRRRGNVIQFSRLIELAIYLIPSIWTESGPATFRIILFYFRRWRTRSNTFCFPLVPYLKEKEEEEKK